MAAENKYLPLALALCLTLQAGVPSVLAAAAVKPQAKPQGKATGAKSTLSIPAAAQNQADNSAKVQKVQQCIANFKGDKWAVVIGVSRFPTAAFRSSSIQPKMRKIFMNI